ncbi:MAG: hypothetical protein QM650_19720 [Microlunatus sp.]
MSRIRTAIRTVLDQGVVSKVREGRLRDDGLWPYGLRAVVTVGCVLFVLTGLLALVSAPIRSWSSLNVPNTLTSSVPEGAVWALIFLLGFCLALFTVAAVHGPWWLRVAGLVALALLLGIWSSATVPTVGVGAPVLLTALTVLVVGVLMVVRRRREPAWWEFPLLLGLIGLVLAFSTHAYADTSRRLGYRMSPVFLDQTMSMLTFVVLPAVIAAGAAVAEIAVGLTMAATKTSQRAAAGKWPYVVLAALVVLRLVQEVRRLSHFDVVNSGWRAFLPAVGLVAAFAVLGWVVSRLTQLDTVSVADLPDDLSRISVGVGVGLITLMIPVYVVIFFGQIVVSLDPVRAVEAEDFIDTTPWTDQLLDGFRVLLGVLLVALGLWQARRHRPGLALVLGGSGVMLFALSARLLTGYRWALWVDPDALVSVVTAGVLVVLGWLLARRRLSRDRTLGLAAVLTLAVLLSMRSLLSDPVAALIGSSGVAFVLFGVTWDFLTSSEWANSDGRRLRRPTRVLLAMGYPLLTVTVVAADVLIRRPATFSAVNAFAELGELVLGTALLAAAAIVVLSAVRGDREVV